MATGNWIFAAFNAAHSSNCIPYQLNFSLVLRLHIFLHGQALAFADFTLLRHLLGASRVAQLSSALIYVRILSYIYINICLLLYIFCARPVALLFCLHGTIARPKTVADIYTETHMLWCDNINQVIKMDFLHPNTDDCGGIIYFFNEQLFSEEEEFKRNFDKYIYAGMNWLRQAESSTSSQLRFDRYLKNYIFITFRCYLERNLNVLLQESPWYPNDY